MMTLTSLISPSFRLAKRLSNVTRVLLPRCSINARFARSSPAARAVFSSSNVTKRSPACGTSFNPVISTGVAGPASLSRRPISFVITRTRPKVLPTTIGSPTFNVPCCTNNVATGPFPLSRRASMTVPIARCVGSAFKSSTSATNRIISSNSSMFLANFAEISTKIVSPPHASGINPCSLNACMT